MDTKHLYYVIIPGTNNVIKSEYDYDNIAIQVEHKENENFKKFVETNVEQGYERINLPIGISFESKTIYIPKQKSSLYIKKYIKLVELFKQYIDKI